MERKEKQALLDAMDDDIKNEAARRELRMEIARQKEEERKERQEAFRILDEEVEMGEKSMSNSWEGREGMREGFW